MPSIVPDLRAAGLGLTPETIANIEKQCGRPENAAVTALHEGRKRVTRDLDGYRHALSRAEQDVATAKANIRSAESEIAQIDCALAVLDAKVT